jgi:hypothetical protein
MTNGNNSDKTSIIKITSVVSVTDSTEAHSNLSIALQHDIAGTYISSAALYTRQCAEIENKYVPNSLSEFSREFEILHIAYKAHATSSIWYSAAFLEALINKYIFDAREYYKSGDTTALDYQAWQTINQETSQNLSPKQRTSGQYEILRKFDIVLFAYTQKGSIYPKSPYQYINQLNTFNNTELLVNLRNGYMHYKPFSQTVLRENLIVDEFDDKKIDELRLKNAFSLNQLLSIGPQRPFFPEQCLGYGCAKWAVETSILFAEEFCKAIGKPFPYEHFRPYLKTTI